jgi:RNA polymerase sigma-70 factor (ECF subfamily)
LNPAFRLAELFGNTNSKYQSLDDADLLDQYHQSGALDLLGVLFQRHMHLVYGVCLKYLKDSEESKDAVMQIFEKLVEKIPNQEIRNFKSWLYVVTKNHCLMILRSKQTREKSEEVFMETLGILHLNGEEKNYSEELISKAVSQLSVQQQHCIRLFYFQEKSYQQIAVETGYELKKVKSYIQNGKRNLKIYLDQHER